MKATAIANSNIAFVKYWGKKDSLLNIPMNPSISMTLDENLSTKTTVEFSEKYNEDELILNNEKQTGNKLERVSKFLDLVREKTNTKLKAKVVSKNSFPTGSGIASSASGFAALAHASCKVLNLNVSKKELSGLARQGSGSAARSVYGGFVEWHDKYSKQIKDETFWPELRDVIIIIDTKEKEVSSREGMQKTVLESKLYKERIKNIKNRLKKITSFLLRKNFSMLAYEIMKDSDDMHACINEVGINYLNKTSYELKKKIIYLNNEEIKAAYSFDAGPNIHIITLKKYLPLVIEEFADYKKMISKPGKGVRLTKEHLF